MDRKFFFSGNLYNTQLDDFKRVLDKLRSLLFIMNWKFLVPFLKLSLSGYINITLDGEEYQVKNDDFTKYLANLGVSSDFSSASRPYYENLCQLVTQGLYTTMILLLPPAFGDGFLHDLKIEIFKTDFLGKDVADLWFSADQTQNVFLHQPEKVRQLLDLLLCNKICDGYQAPYGGEAKYCWNKLVSYGPVRYDVKYLHNYLKPFIDSWITENHHSFKILRSFIHNMAPSEKGQKLQFQAQTEGYLGELNKYIFSPVSNTLISERYQKMDGIRDRILQFRGKLEAVNDKLKKLQTTYVDYDDLFDPIVKILKMYSDYYNSHFRNVAFNTASNDRLTKHLNSRLEKYRAKKKLEKVNNEL